ncbi:MAG TPA: lipopolysaccharide assembly protein LapA domain-containing protein [Thermoleophilaceae bacterium]|nr:lipopolysaccharide assembly protein LapA domain-containing protein [Thermoleophilaceae bacterium]
MATSAAQPTRARRGPTRTSGAWTGAIAGTVVALLLLIFILENTQSVKVSFLGAHGHISLGVALLLSAVAGALIVGLIGAARMAQLRLRARRAERAAP